MLDVRSVKPYLLLGSNSSTSLPAVGHQVATVLRRDVVAVQTNLDYDSDADVEYTVIREPVSGTLELVDNDGRTRPSCGRFTLDDVQRGSVVYRVTDAGDVTSDEFVIVVRLDDLQTTASVDVDLRRRRSPATSTTQLPLPASTTV